MNTVLATIHNRRSIRRFSDRQLEPHHIETILDAGRWAPSGKNTQPWRFVVVRSEDKKKQLAKFAPQANMVATAPITLAILLDKAAGYDQIKDVQAIGAAIQNILLAVHSLGLAACWMGKCQDTEIELLLQTTDTEELMAIIPIGYPDEKPAGSSRRRVDEIARFI